jgi:transcriptional regulator with XRE-family HTH domain
MIADRIQKRRVALNLTQEAAAEKLDIAPTTLQYIEQRRKFPSLPMLLYICRVFGIDVKLN